MTDERYSRQIALFGAKGQRRISECRVAIIGLGGLGSHVAQQLAYLGVLGYTLIDHDHVTVSNMNRLIGAVNDDVVAKTMKVAVAERLIESVQPEAEINAIVERLMSDSPIADADIAFGCLDDDLARIELIKACATALTPFFDLATDIDDDPELVYGGRVLFSGKGERCPHCMDLLDQRALQLESMDPRQRTSDDAIYGVNHDALEGTGPSVVSINAVVSSLAVTELTAQVTGLREAHHLLTYRGDLGIVTKSLDEPREGCPYCAAWSNT